MRTLVSLLACALAAGITLDSAPAQAVPVIRQLSGLQEFWGAFRNLDRRPDRLRGRRFKFHYVGPMASGERLRLYIEPQDAFHVERLDRRTYLVSIRRPHLLLEQDFVREISVRAALESRALYSAPGEGYCTLAVSFRSDVGRLIRLSRYDEVDVRWSPREAAIKLTEEPDHVLFRRTEGHGRTPVQVRATVYLRDGTHRVTEPVHLGYCDRSFGDRRSRLGVEVAAGGAAGGGLRPSWDIGLPFEIRADERLHVRLTPTLTWQPEYFWGLVGQVGVGYRMDRSVGFRVGGEAGWVRRNRFNNPIELDALRAAGSFGVIWSLDSISWTEIGLRVRVGSVANEAFGDATFTPDMVAVLIVSRERSDGAYVIEMAEIF